MTEAPTYPPEPWTLRGQLHSSVFLVPLADVPVDLPPGCRPVRVGRFGVVGTAWVSYEPGGVLSYSEVMATLLVRRGWRLMPTITEIWVDSPASRDGGRALWGIPKDLAEFDVVTAGSGSATGSPSRTTSHWSAVGEKGPIATGSVRPRLRLPGRVPVAFSIAQWLDGAVKVSPVRSRAAISLSSASFHADPGGPLGFLAGRSPVASFTMHDFRMSFGRAVG